jgi:hypothetical protein
VGGEGGVGGQKVVPRPSATTLLSAEGKKNDISFSFKLKWSQKQFLDYIIVQAFYLQYLVQGLDSAIHLMISRPQLTQLYVQNRHRINSLAGECESYSLSLSDQIDDKTGALRIAACFLSIS